LIALVPCCRRKARPRLIDIGTAPDNVVFAGTRWNFSRMDSAISGATAPRRPLYRRRRERKIADRAR
jgi:hypothetical protein